MSSSFFLIIIIIMTCPCKLAFSIDIKGTFSTDFKGGPFLVKLHLDRDYI